MVRVKIKIVSWGSPLRRIVFSDSIRRRLRRSLLRWVFDTIKSQLLCFMGWLEGKHYTLRVANIQFRGKVLKWIPRTETIAVALHRAVHLLER